MEKKPHVVCFPSPAQGHINPMMQVAKLLHSRGFFITFVNTDFSHRRLLRSRGHDSLECFEGFRFETISDDLPPEGEITEDFERFCKAVHENCVAPLRDLLKKLHRPSHGREVTCLVSDAFMTFSLEVAKETGIPAVLFCPTAACGFMAFAQYHEIIRRGLAPLKDKSYISNGFLDTTIDWIPGMQEMPLKYLGSFLQTTDPDNYVLNFVTNETQSVLKASVIVFNTFDDLERDVLQAIRSSFPPRIYPIGPLLLQCHLLPDSEQKSIKLSMWKEENECLKWLDNYKANSVIYVNFGSTTVTTVEQLMEFAWGIANSKQPFLWVIRPDLVLGVHTNFPQDFMNEIAGRGMTVSWCPQEDVLAHPSIGVFITHNGWNSTLESISFGVPMLCWPFFGDQQTNCFYTCNEWGVGMEIDSNANREEISALIKEVMEGKKGKEMRIKAMRWKESAELAAKEGGSSHMNLELLIEELLQSRDT